MSKEGRDLNNVKNWQLNSKLDSDHTWLSAACDPSDNDDKATMSATDLAKNIWKYAKDGSKVFPLVAHLAKAQTCIDEFDGDKDGVWNQAEWKAFDQMMMQDTFNFILLLFSKEQADSCIPTTVSFTAKDLKSKLQFLTLAKAEKCIDKYDGDRDGAWNKTEWKKFDKLLRKLAKQGKLRVLKSC